jgi:hypothetical protein
MTKFKPIAFRLKCGAAAAALLCVSPTIAASQPTKAPAAKPASVAPTAPPVKGGPGSLNGVWNNPNFKDYRTGPPVGAKPNLTDENGAPIPMKPEIAKLVEEHLKGFDDGQPSGDLSANCLTDGMPAVMSPPPQLPIQFVETANQVTVLFEYFWTFRNIYLNAKHPEDPDPAFMGHAVGRWEGDTLVVDTIGIKDKTKIRNLIPHSEKLHIVERIRRTGPDTMENRMTIDDPEVFTRPWTWLIRYKQVEGMRLQEFVCENNRNAPDENGKTTIQLQGN